MTPQKTGICPLCGNKTLPDSNFCNKCGINLKQPSPADPGPILGTYKSDLENTIGPYTEESIKSERKYVTILFSELSDYREISRPMDPEDTSELISSVFNEIADLIIAYDGYIERIIWNGILAVFGMPDTHEDDAVRAVKVAIEIDEIVKTKGEAFFGLSKNPLRMQTGIFTGMAITGKTDERTGRHGITGDTVNLASRLRDMADAGEILVGKNTYMETSGFFSYEKQGNVSIKGKTGRFSIYKVLRAVDLPRKVHRVHGRKADLIGRNREMALLSSAASDLKQNQGMAVFLSGDAGTGKSRLISEFKTKFETENTRWLEGHAYAYSKGTPYAPFIDMFTRVFNINKKDDPEKIREKIETGIDAILEEGKDVAPYIAGLFIPIQPGLEATSPEIRKNRLFNSTARVLSGLAQRSATLICMEDLHWADPSTIELLRFILKESGLPVMFIFSSRPPFSLFPTDEPLPPLSYDSLEIVLNDLTPHQISMMTKSLLRTDRIPQGLNKFILNDVEGNPFFLEEIINNLIESEVLVYESGDWQLKQSVDNTGLFATVNGVITGRLDRLEKRIRRILQEASVIGRVFQLDILKKITIYEHNVEAAISALEHLDMIRKLDDSKDLSYTFKHAIAQDVVYNGLLKRDRRTIHETVALEMERMYKDRIDGFIETIALHFSNGYSSIKAAEYFIKSGEKSFEQYAIEESHGYFKKAYQILNTPDQFHKDQPALLVDTIIKWYFVFNKSGLFSEMLDILERHEETAELMSDKHRKGMYNVCMGWALQRKEKFSDSYAYLIKALKIGNAIKDFKIIAYSCACLNWTCTELGQYKEALVYGSQATTVLKHLPPDSELTRFSLAGIGITCFLKGDLNRCMKISEMLIAHGEKGGDLRMFSEGYLMAGMSRFGAGDYDGSIAFCTKAINTSPDPIYVMNANFFLSYAYASKGDFDEARRCVEDVLDMTKKSGYDYIGTSATALCGMLDLAEGNLKRGIRVVKNQMQKYLEDGRMYHYSILEHVMGSIYLKMVVNDQPPGFKFFLKNLGVLFPKIFFTRKKAERHFRRAIELVEKIGSDIKAAQYYFDLGLLYRSGNKQTQAITCFEKSVALYQKCGADFLLKTAQSALVEQSANSSRSRS